MRDATERMPRMPLGRVSICFPGPFVFAPDALGDNTVE